MFNGYIITYSITRSCLLSVGLNVNFCHVIAAVDMLAWSPDGGLYIMVAGNRIDICAFEVCGLVLYATSLHYIMLHSYMCFTNYS